jgi:hypothetical protein
MAWDEDESMDVDVDKNEVNVDENEMDVHNIIQVEVRRQRLNIVNSNGGWWVMHTTIVVVRGGGGCMPLSCWACWVGV